MILGFHILASYAVKPSTCCSPLWSSSFCWSFVGFQSEIRREVKRGRVRVRIKVRVWVRVRVRVRVWARVKVKARAMARV